MTTTTAHAADMKQRAQKQFEKWAETYDRSFLHRLMFRPSYLCLMEEIATWQRENPRPFKALDVGCGTGLLAGILARAPWSARAIGMDYSPNMCVQAERNAARNALAEVTGFTAGDSEFLPFGNESFDVVTCSNSFHHYPHQDRVVAEVKRILRPGGIFILIDGFRDNIIGWVVFDVIVASVEKNIHHATWREIDGHFRSAGFRNIRRRKINTWMPLCCTVGQA